MVRPCADRGEAGRARRGDRGHRHGRGGASRSTTTPDRAVVAFVRELLRTGRSGDAAYAAARALLGEKGTVELTGLVGYYSLLAMQLNVFQVVPPPTAPHPLGRAGRGLIAAGSAADYSTRTPVSRTTAAQSERSSAQKSSMSSGLPGIACARPRPSGRDFRLGEPGIGRRVHFWMIGRGVPAGPKCQTRPPRGSPGYLPRPTSESPASASPSPCRSGQAADLPSRSNGPELPMLSMTSRPLPAHRPDGRRPAAIGHVLAGKSALRRKRSAIRWPTLPMPTLAMLCRAAGRVPQATNLRGGRTGMPGETISIMP